MIDTRLDRKARLAAVILDRRTAAHWTEDKPDYANCPCIACVAWRGFQKQLAAGSRAKQ